MGFLLYAPVSSKGSLSFASSLIEGRATSEALASHSSLITSKSHAQCGN